MLPAFARYENVEHAAHARGCAHAPRAARGRRTAAHRRRRLHRPGGAPARRARRRRGDGRSRPSRCRCTALLGQEIGELVRRRCTVREGVELVLGHTAAQIHGDGRLEAVTLDDGRRMEADHVLVGIGIVPELDWLAGLRAAGRAGSRPTRAAAASSPDIYAAGDAAAFYDAFLGRHALSGHWEAAGARARRWLTRSWADRCRRRRSRASGATSTERGSSTWDTRRSPTASPSTATPARATSSPSTPATESPWRR